MYELLKRKLLIVIIFSLITLSIKTACYYSMYNRFTLGYFYIDLFISYIFLSPFLIFKNKYAEIGYSSFIAFVICLFYVINACYYNVKTDVFSIYYFGLIGKGLKVFSPTMLDFRFVFGVIKIFIAGIFAILYVVAHFDKVKEIPQAFYKRFGIILASALIGSIMFSFASFEITSSIEKARGKNTIDHISMEKISNYRKLGMLGFYYKELEYLYSKPDEKPPYIELKENSYTGTLEGYNVFTIMIETGTKLMVNETLTPNLYNMLNEGIECSNNHSYNDTNVSEFIGMCGGYPSTKLSVDTTYNVDVSVANLLKEEYDTMYFHDAHEDVDIYNRKKLIPMIGFEESYFSEELRPLDKPWTWEGDFPLDTETVVPVVDKIVNRDSENPFYAFWTTLQMHGPYGAEERLNVNLLKEKYYDRLKAAELLGLWENPIISPVYEPLKLEYETYMLAAMDFDASLGYLIDELKKAEEFDDTLFVLYGDHSIYYNNISGVIYGHDNDKYYADMYQTVLCFYNQKLTKNYVEDKKTNKVLQFTSPNVIVPTILNLLDVKGQSAYYMGYSLFSDEFKNVQVLYSKRLGSFFNDEYFYNDIDSDMPIIPQKLPEDIVTEEQILEYLKLHQKEIDEFMNEVNNLKNKQKVIDDYYKTLESSEEK